MPKRVWHIDQEKRKELLARLEKVIALDLSDDARGGAG